ncbi:MAG: glycoside hydrolase family 3 C-terminal domain-containing protein [Streptosporangiaceae bacterium]|nr:glycoside hydrolase family 3 C-terminal domain-containing protein [Streptosporangiaceae bacterium]MBV9856505.1 glycoside hydrolase family 3 C-terminal domain-containing protein [Streptosporangiaceae bacterium]
MPVFKTGTEALHGVAWSNDLNNNGNVVDSNGTSFPQAIGLASTWDPALVNRVGNAVGQDARGYNAENPTVWGLNLWAPVVNLLRNPLWGRNEEGYSEDPFLTSAIATAYGRGIEGNNPHYLQAAPTLKHYLAYNNEVNRSVTSSEVPPRVLQEYDRAAFRGPLEAGAATGVMASYNEVNGRPDTVNPDLNSIERSWSSHTLMNVTDAGANYNLLPGAGNDNYYPDLEHVDAAAIKAGIDSFTTDNTNSSITISAVTAALHDGLLTMADINKAVYDVLSIRFRLGDFDPPGLNPYAKITPAVIDDAAHRALSRKAADEAMVLLKNDHRTLPLNPVTTKKVAVIGPLEDTLYSDWYSGNLPYKVTPLDGITQRLGPGATVTGTEGVDRIALKDVATGKYVAAGTGASGAKLAETAASAGPATQFDAFDWGDGVLTLRAVANGKYVNYESGGFVNDQTQPNGWFVQQMFQLDPQPDGTYVLQYAGYDSTQSWFGPNVYVTVAPDGTLTLGASTPAAAAHFARDVVTSGIASAVQAAKGAGAAVVVVGSMPFINGREAHDRTGMNLASGQEALVEAVTKANPRTIVVVEDSYPTTINWEQRNDPAILWTTHAGQETGHALADVLFGDYNPSGRLTQTWPRSQSEVADILDYDIIKSGQTYMYSTQPVLYPFGYGLSYTTFRYGRLRLSSGEMGGDGHVTASVGVTNTGSRAGRDVVQLYEHQERSRVRQPAEKLIGFQNVDLAPGQTRTVRFDIRASDLAFWDVTRNKWAVERSAFDLMAGDSLADVDSGATLRVDGEVIPPRNLTVPTLAENFDNYQGAQLVDQSKASGTAVGATAAGQWIEFADAGLRDSPAAFTAQVAKGTPGTAQIQIRLDNPVSGPVIGTATVNSTGDIYAYTTTTASLAGAHGIRDVYLVFTGDLRISSFTMK